MRGFGAVALAGAVLCGSCASVPPRPGNLTIGRNALGPVIVRANNDPPEILSMAFNSLDVTRGTTWTGDFITTSNVASVEVRSNLFSIDAPRGALFGHFHFAVDVYDVPPIFLRNYTVRIIARNSAGVQAEEDVPLRIR